MAVMLLMSGCGSSDGDDRLQIEVGEWFVNPEPGPLNPGRFTFDVHNSGQLTHELELYRQVGDYQEYEIVEIEDIGAGETASFSAQLNPGMYELICTIVERRADGTVMDHYALGMKALITVEDR
jgi:uncharacterized cupredoxin-like copper-binding protein